MEVILFLILFFALIGSFILVWRNQDNKAAYFLSGGVLILFTALYMVTFLEYEIKGEQLSLERARADLNKSRKEMEQVSSTVSEVAVFLSERAAEWGDFPIEYREQLDTYLTKLDPYVESGLAERVKKDFERAHEKYEQAQN